MSDGKPQLFEYLHGQRICVDIAQCCMDRIEQIPSVTIVDLRHRAILDRIINACRDVHQENQTVFWERQNDAHS